MSVLIRGMKMPKNCVECPIRCLCSLYTGRVDIRNPDCPLVEVKEPHGRLIDADEPMTKISTMMQEPDYQHDGENWMVGLIMARDAIDDAPTVIEAEGET